MALDIIARAVAAAARSDATKALARSVRVDTFLSLSSVSIDPAIATFTTGGYSNTTDGGALYIADALATAALATAHPRFCKQSGNGRYFRLSGGSVTVEQGGASGIGNDQPAMQATIDYALAVGIQEVRFTRSAYEAWSPVRTDTANWHQGHMLYIPKGNISLVGPKGGATIIYKNSAGGSNDIVTQTFTGTGSLANWKGCGIWFEPATNQDFFRIENLIIDGTSTYSPADRSNVDLTHKGVACWNSCQRMTMYNVTLKNWGGEIFYIGGNGLQNLVTENVVLDGSPQCSMNGLGQRSTHINLEAGNSYQNEIMGNASTTFVGGRFYDCSSISVFGGPDPSPNGAYATYTHPVRKTTDNAPWVNFERTKIENCGNLLVYRWVRGSIQTIDTTTYIGGTGVYNLRDIDLDVEAWCDLRSNFPAVAVTGIADLVTPVDGAHPTEYREPTKHVYIRARCERTALAAANSRSFSYGLQIYPQLYDKDNCRFEIRGDAVCGFAIQGTPVAGFAFPLIRTDMNGPTVNYGSFASFLPTANFAIDILSDGISINPQAAGTFVCSFSNTYGYSDGQEVTLYNVSSAGNRMVRFSANGAGYLCPKDRLLQKSGDWIKFRWNSAVNKWIEVGYYFVQGATWFTGSKTYDAPSIAAAGTTTTTVTVTGTALGDRVTSLSFGVSLLGLVASAYVSTSNTVTVVLFNPTAAAIDLATTTLSVTTERQL